MSLAIPEISVIVPHYHDRDRLERCLAALEQQTLPRDRYEIIIADNDSPCDLSALRSRAHVITATLRGAGPARNAGVAASSGIILAFTDADCLPGSDWLAEGVAALADADIVGGAISVSIEHEGAMTGAEAFESVFAFDNRDYVESKGFSVTANLFCRRAVFDAVGPFRVGVSEDLDWCLRARAKGFSIRYASGAKVSHPARADWPTLRRKWERLNAESFALACEAPGGRLRWALRSFAIPASIILHAPRIFRSPIVRSPRERAAALATLVRLRCWRFVDAQRLLMHG